MTGKKGEKEAKPPKKPMPAFFLYKTAKTAVIKVNNPTAKVSEITRIAAQMWSQESVEEKEKYQKLFEEDKNRYNKELDEFTKIHGKPEKKARKIKKGKKDKSHKKEKTTHKKAAKKEKKEEPPVQNNGEAKPAAVEQA